MIFGLIALGYHRNKNCKCSGFPDKNHDDYTTKKREPKKSKKAKNSKIVVKNH